MLTISKKYSEIPIGHRQPFHDGHCAWLHGHNWSFEFTFACDKKDDNGFVVDFGKLGFLKSALVKPFDHAMMISSKDPLLNDFIGLQSKGAMNIVVLDDVSCEGLAEYLFIQSNKLIEDHLGTDRGVRVVGVVVEEDTKNISEYKIL